MRFVVLVYALLILIGGIIGHLKSASLASLIAGVISGVVLLIAAGGMFARKSWGAYLALCATFILDGFFSWRYINTLKFFPPGFFSLLSLAVLISLALSIRRK